MAMASAALKYPTPLVRPHQMRFCVSRVSYSSMWPGRESITRRTRSSQSGGGSRGSPPVREEVDVGAVCARKRAGVFLGSGGDFRHGRGGGGGGKGVVLVAGGPELFDA